jgi:1-acyl-sn-glycerol-3-phosphate acyltransferase
MVTHQADAPQFLIEQNVLEILRQFVTELGTDRVARAVSLDASLDRDLGLGSLERVELLFRIEKAFSVQIQEHLVAQARTPRDLVQALLQAERKQPYPLERLAPIGEASAPPLSAATLIEVLLTRAESEPDRVTLYLPQETGEERQITYRELLNSANLIAGSLLERGLNPRETVAIMLPTGSDFFFSFFGVLLAGGIPVPLYPPFRIDQIEEYAHRQVAILRKASARFLITSHQVEGLARLLRPLVPNLAEIIATEQLKRISPGPIRIMLGGDDPALIQFTSGSTGMPKGVLLTHENILANIRAIVQAAAFRATDVGVSWLPLYHDMGLIGSWLCPLYFGIPVAILSPITFLTRPERWLWTIHYHQATLSSAPNFAYELCVRKIDDRAVEGLDLSSWRIAFNGAEPVSPDTLARFTRRFAPYGFREETLLPVYGLAESSVALSFPTLGHPPRIDRVARELFERQRKAAPASPSEPSPLRFVSCGIPLPGHEIRIVDHLGQEVAERIEGTLLFRGPSVMRGYFQDPESTEAAFRDGWCDSGDLAYRADGEIFITGRRKDIIIKAGRNLYPQEVEEVAGEISGIRKGCVAAFGITDPDIGTEKLVIVAETREKGKEVRRRLAGEVMERVAAATDVRPDLVLIVPPGAVPKTSSGKLRRSACREAYLRGEIGRRRRAAPIQIARLWIGSLSARMQRHLAVLGSLIYTGYVGIILFITLLPTWIGLLILSDRQSAARLSRLWAGLFLRLAGCPLIVEGESKRIGAGPTILVSNHASYIDAIVLMAALPPRFLFVAKQELTRVAIVRTFIKKIGYPTVSRIDIKSNEETARMQESLQKGWSVLVFPEGTFSRIRGLRSFRLGAFKVAAETATPLCPISLRGTRDYLPSGRWRLRRGPIHVVIGDPIIPKGKEWGEIVRLREAAKRGILRHCGELPLDRVAAEIPEE